MTRSITLYLFEVENILKKALVSSIRHSYNIVGYMGNTRGRNMGAYRFLNTQVFLLIKNYN